MNVQAAIRRAERLLPGVPAETGRDPRWQAIIAIGEFIESDPEPIWQFVAKWGAHDDEDLRDAVACCLLEHVLEERFDAYFPRVEALATEDLQFGDMFCRCWKMGQSEQPANAERFDRLQAKLGYVLPRLPTTPEEIAGHEVDAAKCDQLIELAEELARTVNRLIEGFDGHPEHFGGPGDKSENMETPEKGQ